MSLASETRAAAREHPFLLAGLRAGVINYTAAARFLDVGETEAVAAALRRFADEQPAYTSPDRSVRVTIESGIEATDNPADEATDNPTDEATDHLADAVLTVGDAGFGRGTGSLVAVVATGDVDPPVVSAVLERLAEAGVELQAAGFSGDSLVIVVDRNAGHRVIRVLESTFAAGPPRPSSG